MSGLLPFQETRLRQRIGQFATQSGDGLGNQQMTGDYSITPANFMISGNSVRLDGSKNARLELVLQDSFVGLISHTVFFTGIKVGLYQ